MVVDGDAEVNDLGEGSGLKSGDAGFSGTGLVATVLWQTNNQSLGRVG
jgi:hypothetical protein